MVHVLDLFDLGIPLKRNRIEPEALPHHLKAWLELGQVLDPGSGPHVLVSLEHRNPNRVLHGDD